ncbi:hypothetical protein [Kitasatospora sp. NPDC057223]|uniref:hypothetical protein n=1 Tax=Kitasatospora sp. NPDC057223 TaxID=3346055 RepID=UPI00363CE63D
MSEPFVDLGSVTTPSGVLVLGLGSWIDLWPELGAPLSERAGAAAAAGGGHLRDEECEAVAVPAAAGRPLRVRAATAPSWVTEDPVISVLEVGLGLPWTRAGDAPVLLGDLPVDRGGMVIGDGSGLDVWRGMHAEPADGLADVIYWGLHADDAHARFGGQRMPSPHGPWGRPDLPVAEAETLATEIEVWRGGLGSGRGVAVSVERHTDFYRAMQAGEKHPLLAGAVEVGGCRMLGIGWDPSDHSMLHRGGRAEGLVHPVTLETDGAGGTVLRWTIRPPEGEE